MMQLRSIFVLIMPWLMPWVMALFGFAMVPFVGAQTIPPPSNTPYAGTLSIEVDLTDLDRKIMPVRQTLPVVAGPLTLLYPRWIPGTHSPTGSVTRMAGLQIDRKSVV